MVIACDAGMLSARNLAELDAHHLRLIVGSRVTKAPHDLASHFRWYGDHFTDGQIIDTVTPRHAGVKNVNDASHRDEPVWDPSVHAGAWRAVWAYSKKRAVRDRFTLTEQENRARAVIDGDKAVNGTRFVKTSASGRSLDESALARVRRVVGLKGYVTNIPARIMPPSEVMQHYHDLWHVEQSFRMSKTDLQARPMLHHTLKPLQDITLSINGHPHTARDPLTPDAKHILTSLNIQH